MKNSLAPFLLLGTTFLFSCSNGPETDSKKVADSTNTARIDSAKSVDTTNHTTLGDLKQDADFAVAVADGGMLEIALGKMAEKNGTGSAVKKFGRQMVTDHTKAADELKKLAAGKNIDLPKEMSEKCQKVKTDLEEKKGKDFDKAYIDQMVKDHKDVVDEFKKESEKGNDTQISAWAKATLPTIEHHLMMAEDIQKNMK
jgi:putative membrane protein